MAEPEVRWTDSHCHLPDDPDDAATVVEDARTDGVVRMIDVGTDVASSTRATERAKASVQSRSAGEVQVYATVGIHPHDAKDAFTQDGTLDLDSTVRLLGEPGVVAVGECGLDYHYDHSPRDQQRAVFAAQVRLAHEHDLALVIHTREAWDDTFAILEAEGLPPRTVFHCFTGGPEEARRALDLGAHLSFSGIVTFPSAPEVRDACVLCPKSRLLVETDAPYLAPVPFRGRKNRPALVAVVGAAVAATRGEPVAELAEATWDNAAAVFGLW